MELNGTNSFGMGSYGPTMPYEEYCNDAILITNEWLRTLRCGKLGWK
ncbi:hypothetical protein GGD81_004580 [Rhodobium orientis]|nr:hypothetical protein [Rhodobium orientis]